MGFSVSLDETGNPREHAMALDVSTVPPADARPGREADLATRAAADGVRFLLALFVDLTGKPCAKLVPVEAADELQYEGVGFAGYAVGAIGQQPCDPDLIAIPAGVFGQWPRLRRNVSEPTKRSQAAWEVAR